MPRGRLAAVVLSASLLWPVAARAQNTCKAYPTVLCCQTAGGGAAAWGDITGTLSAQTDLQTALDNKEAAGAFSGIGVCAANQWASTLNDTAAPTCTQPGFSNLSGAATSAQLPNPGAGSKGGVQSLTCSGTDKLSAIGTDGIPVCSAAGGGGFTHVVLAADVVNDNATANTIADVTGLSFAVTAGKTYVFRFMILYTSAATTTGSRWSFNGPASPTFLAYKSRYTLAVGTSTRNEMLAAYDVPAGSNATSSANGNYAFIEGIIRPSANGTVIARFASEIASSAITAKAGSLLEWKETL